MKKQNKIVEKVIIDLLKEIGVNAEVDIDDSDEAFSAKLDSSEDNALLIGKYGNTLASLELIITLIVSNKLEEFKRVTLEIGSYKEEREKYLRELADRLRDEVIESGYEKPVRGLKPWERRFVHLHLENDKSVTTESVGENRDRTLVIKKK